MSANSEFESAGYLTVSAVRKNMARLIPILTSMYVVAFIDRSNLGYAKTAFMADTGLSETAFALGASIFFLGYALFEIPSNLILYRVGARAWLTRIMVTWGLVSASMAFTHNAMGFYVLRFLLGIAEAGFFPGVIVYLTYWFPSRARGQALGFFYFGLPMASVLGGPLSGLLLQSKAPLGMASWQWMFFIEGLLACGVGLIAYTYLRDAPESAHWLSAEEKSELIRQLLIEDKAKSHRSISKLSTIFRNPLLIRLCVVYIAIQMSVYGVVFYLPTRISEVVGAKVGLGVGVFSAIPWMCAIGVTWFATQWAGRRATQRRMAVLMMVLASAGMCGSVMSSRASLVILAFCVAVSGFVAVQPLFWTLPVRHLRGMAAAAGIALINSFGNLGGFLAPNLKAYSDRVFSDPRAGTMSLAGIALLGAAILMLQGKERLKDGNDDACTSVNGPDKSELTSTMNLSYEATCFGTKNVIIA